MKPILLLRGRTWSSVPVFRLLGGPKNNNGRHESRSLMEALLAKELQPYCMDFRGFGGTHPGETGFVKPYVASKMRKLCSSGSVHGMGY